MTIKHTFLVSLLLLLLSACVTPRYLPQPDEIGLSTLGSYIIIKLNAPEDQMISGELIAIRNQELIILASKKKSKKLILVSLDNIKNYKLKYANSRKFDWTIPVFGIATLTHGWFAFITLPVNLLFTSLAASDIAYNYNQEELPPGLLNRFARFPQGLPEGISFTDLK